MSNSAADRLKSLGLDVDFLIWLEGAADRLPQIDRLKEVSGANLAAAVRAAAWLTSQFADPDVVEPDEADSWRERYQTLQGLLWNALCYSTVYHRLGRPDDLAALDSMLDVLAPPARAAMYRRDLQRLRDRGKPEQLRDLDSKIKKPRRGGPRPSERVQRMRAAVEHLRTKTNRPYRHLADLWNEALGELRYTPDQLRLALRKGQDAGPNLLELWGRIYRGEPWGDLLDEFPGGRSSARGRGTAAEEENS